MNTIDDRYIPLFSPTCSLCKHLRRGRTCDAFQKEDGIPLDIWLGKNNHTQPVEGDRGIVFEDARQ